MLRSLLKMALVLGIVAPAQADIVTRCGPSTGYAYYFAGPLTSSAQLGWQKDGIANGGLHLIASGLDYDLIYTDAFGTRSAKGDGFVVMRMPGAPRILLLAMNIRTGVVEHYLFDLDSAGRGTVLWGTIRLGEPFPKSSLMAAKCTGP